MNTQNNQPQYEDIQNAIEAFDSDEKSISSQSKDRHQLKLFSSPIHVAEFLQMHKPESYSPQIQQQFSNSFRRILENENEELEENEEMLDIMGNRICQFQIKIEECDVAAQIPPILQDKENQLPSSYLNTPLKIKRKDIRSPLEDITPSMTKKKKKTDSKLMVSQKSRLLTPRTMEKSGLSTSGLRRIQRF